MLDLSKVFAQLSLLGENLVKLLEEKHYGLLGSDGVIHKTTACTTYHKPTVALNLTAYKSLMCGCMSTRRASIARRAWSDLYTTHEDIMYVPMSLRVTTSNARSVIETAGRILGGFYDFDTVIASTLADDQAAFTKLLNKSILSAAEELLNLKVTPRSAAANYLAYFAEPLDFSNEEFYSTLAKAVQGVELTSNANGGLFYYRGEDCMYLSPDCYIVLKEAPSLKVLEATRTLCTDGVPLADALKTAEALEK